MTEPKNYHVVRRLKMILPADTWEWVIPALRADDLIWKTILTPERYFNGRHLEEIIQSANDCTPAILSLKALAYPHSVEELRTLPLIEVHPSFEELVENAAVFAVQSLSEAGLSALKLRNKRLSTGSWNDWTSLLIQASPTVLTCLFGMIPDQIDFLCALLPHDAIEPRVFLPQSKEYDLLIHILSSNPQPLASKIELIRVLFQTFTPDQRTAFIMRLFAKDPAFASHFTSELPKSPSSTNLAHSEQRSALTTKIDTSVFDLHTDLQQEALAEDLQQQIQDLVLTHAHHLTKLAIISARQGSTKDSLSFLENAFQLMPQSEMIASSYLIALLSEKPLDYIDKIKFILSHFEENSSPLIHFLEEIFQYEQNQSNVTTYPEALPKLADQAMDELRQFAAQMDDSSSQKDIYLFLLAQFIALMIPLHLFPEAEECTSILLDYQPNNIPLLITSAYLNHQSARHQVGNDILEYCECFTHPNQAFFLFLSQSYQATHHFEEALTTLEKITPFPEFSQQEYELASIALQAHSNGLTQTICKTLLEQSPDDGIALALYAEASDELSSEQREIKLEQATQLNPSHPYPWLAYARFLKTINQKTKSCEVLKAAAQTLPQSAEIQLALGKFYADEEQPSLALPHLRAAEQILNKNTPAPLFITPAHLFNQVGEIPDFTEKIRLRYSNDYGDISITYDQLMAILVEYLGQTLRQLGHLDEAQDLLETQIHHYPENSSIAYQLAKTYLQKGDFQSAEDLLRDKIIPFMARPDALVDYARCLWRKPTEETNAEAIECLNKAIQLKPDYFAAYPLLADFLLRNGEADGALKVYDQIFQFPQVKEASILEKMRIGLSQAALQAGKHELALATLLECDPSNVVVLKLLAQTYAKSGLPSEAIKYANLVLEKDPQDVDTLAWYAVFLSQLPKTPGEDLQARQSMTIKALEIALEKDPQRDDLTLLLGDTYYELGQSVKALQTYQDFVNHRLVEGNVQIEPNRLEGLAQTLINLGDFDNAVICWKYRLSQIQNSAEPHPNEAAPILATLASIYRHQNDYAQMQTCYQQALECIPDDPQYTLNYLEAVCLGVKTLPALSHQPDKLEIIQQKLESALQEHPEVPDLALALALIYRLLGKHGEAISLLQYLARQLKTDNLALESEARSEWIAETQLQLARIYHINLQPSMAKETLQDATSQMSNPEPQNDGSLYKLWCDWIEQTLHPGDSSPINYQKLCEIDPQNLHLQAIAIKLKLINGDKLSANNLFESALQSIGRPTSNPSHPEFSSAVNWLISSFEQLHTYYSFADIALQNGNWNVALELLNKIIDASPNEALAHYKRAFSVIARAEYQSICKGVDLYLSSPGEAAFSETSQNVFHTSIKWLKSELASSEIISKRLSPKIEEFELRSKCIFNGETLTIDSFPTQNPSLALIAAKLQWLSTHSTDIDLAQASYPYQNNPYIQFILSNCYQFTDPKKGIHILEGLLQSDGNDLGDTTLPEDTWVTFPEQLQILAMALYAKLILGQYYHSEQFGEKYELAIHAIQTALEYYPDEPRWNKIYAQLLLSNPIQRINLIQASQALEKAITAEPRQLESQLMLAKLQIELNQNSQAVDTLLTAYQLYPDNIELKVLISQAYASAQNPTTAVQFADLAVSQDPTNLLALGWRTELALAMGDVPLAEELIARALESQQEASEIHKNQAKLAILKGNYTEALRIYEDAFPVELQFETELIERVHLTREIQGMEKAFSLLQDFLEKIPHAVGIQRLYANYLAEAGHIEEAITAAQTALRICHQPFSHCNFREHALCHRVLGELFSTSGHLDQAVHHLSEAVQLNPDDAESYFLLGEVYSARGDYNRSLGNYLQAIQIDPNNAKACFKAGLLYKDAKDYPNAEQMFRQAAKIEPNNLTIQRQLGAVVALNLLHHRKTSEKK